MARGACLADITTLKSPKIRVIAELRGIRNPKFRSEDASAFGAASCFSRKTSAELFNKKAKLSKSKLAESREKVLGSSIGKGHLAVLDPSQYLVVFKDVPRMYTLFLCSDQYRTHLQQSLRRVDIEKNDLYLPDSLKVTESAKNFIELFNDNFKVYKEMTDKKTGKIHREIARGVMPLFLTTNIQTEASGRGLWSALIDGCRQEMPSTIQNITCQLKPKLVKTSQGIFKDREQVLEILNYMPASQLFWPTNESLNKEIESCAKGLEVVLLNHCGTDFVNEKSVEKAIKQRDAAELANLKHAHFTFLWPMSIYTFHQSTRQKTLDQTVESIYDAMKRQQIICPPAIANSSFADKYKENSNKAFELIKDGKMGGLLEKELIGYVPHNLIIYVKVHVNGWNSVYMLGVRTCREAQGEINNLARQTAKIIKEVCPQLGGYAEPRGVTYEKCPEGKWDTCGYCKGVLANKTSEKL